MEKFRLILVVCIVMAVIVLAGAQNETDGNLTEEVEEVLERCHGPATIRSIRCFSTPSFPIG